ncbi:ATPase, T2SS/T4P/T4SS family [Methylacidimicrobium tartarophylax]|uniref:ATPase, T2SS/T4P/T4SS family n=1 Tax=Methylacidimicrobium tartarophylax TaxID=1041768 RepID=UPI001159B085|nr:ATPase, T2SS/T4P/T4SS family [Methylacidimicrobium tartarophylax]
MGGENARAQSFPRLVKNLNDILGSALQARSTAIHLFEGEAPSARVDGELHPLPFAPVSRQQATLWLQTLVGHEGWSEAEQIGTGQFLFSGPDGVLFRGRFLSGEQGLGAVLLPILPPPAIDERNLPPALRHLADLRGLVVLGGGIATGKTTLLGSLVAWLSSSQSWHILVLEDAPARFSYRPEQSWISHWEIPRHFPDMTSALVSALALEGELVAIDSLREAAEIEAALDLAESGKLVLAAHEAEGGAAGAITSLLRTLAQSGKRSEADRLAATLRTAVSQTLLPRRDGQGVAVLYEILPGHPAVAAAIRAEASASLGEFVQVGPPGGKRVDEAILDLWEAGMVTADDAFRHARDKERVLAHLDGAKGGIAPSTEIGSTTRLASE